ncbi:hypothetical protein GYA49_06600 [Candidatus Beckwithbacteria bacterium]|nr:hypothetical protein [Candidatus Beckwithbacteria bacterium]
MELEPDYNQGKQRFVEWLFLLSFWELKTASEGEAKNAATRHLLLLKEMFPNFDTSSFLQLLDPLELS